MQIHKSPVEIMKYNAELDIVISVDQKGLIEYWSADTFDFPKDRSDKGQFPVFYLSENPNLTLFSLIGVSFPSVNFKFKTETDLYALAKAKTKANSLEVS